MGLKILEQICGNFYWTLKYAGIGNQRAKFKKQQLENEQNKMLYNLKSRIFKKLNPSKVTMWRNKQKKIIFIKTIYNPE